MRTLSYWLCFTLVAAPSIAGLVALLLSFVGISIPFSAALGMLLSFGSPLPPFIAHLVPRVVRLVLGYALLALVLRRLWLLGAKRGGVPQSYAGFPKTLGYIAAVSLVLGVLGLLLSFLLRAGSGVPAGLLLVPATVCMPWAVMLTELLSFRRSARGEA